MPQSLVQIYVHIVFSTKSRKPFVEDKGFRDRVHRDGVNSFKIKNIKRFVFLDGEQTFS